MTNLLICGASHDHVEIEGAEWCAQPGMVRLRGKEAPLETWVAELRRELGFEVGPRAEAVLGVIVQG